MRALVLLAACARLRNMRCAVRCCLRNSALCVAACAFCIMCAALLKKCVSYVNFAKCAV